MDDSKTPITVECEAQNELKQQSETIQAFDTNAGINSTKEFDKQASPDLNLKRKMNEELPTGDLITCDSVSKRQRQDSKDNTKIADDFHEDVVKEAVDATLDAEETYSLIVSNFPESWSFAQICNYVAQSLEGVSVEMEPTMGDSENELRLTFNSIEHRLNSLNALQQTELEGNKLNVKMENFVPDYNEQALTDNVIHDIWQVDPEGLYGLKEEYLATLNVTPPIGNWVHVTNFRCDKSELRDAFQIAGNVVVCSVVNTKTKYAKVMYSHPLEAVQAISMLNDQMLYGLKLSVNMDYSRGANDLLPKGLSSVGPGLGEDGCGVREITREYERFLNGKSTKLNLSLFTAGNINGIVMAKKRKQIVIGDNNDNSTDGVTTASTSSNTSSEPNTLNITKLNPPTPPVKAPIRSPMGPNLATIRAGHMETNNHFRFSNAGPMFRGPLPRTPMMRPMREMGPPGQFNRGFPRPSRMPMPFGSRHSPGLMHPSVSMHTSGSMHHPGPVHPHGHMAPGGPMHPAGQNRPSGPVNLPASIHSTGSVSPLVSLHPAAPVAAAVPGLSPNWPNPQPAGVQMSKCIDANTLKICNLPPSTSFPSLCGKLSTLAHVTSLEFTTPGCAIVKFASPSDADKCFQNYRNIELS